MNFSEFRALLACSIPLVKAFVTLDEHALNAVEARVNDIHAQIRARKAAGK